VFWALRITRFFISTGYRGIFCGAISQSIALIRRCINLVAMDFTAMQTRAVLRKSDTGDGLRVDRTVKLLIHER
jgi:hypothetical protein